MLTSNTLHLTIAKVCLYSVLPTFALLYSLNAAAQTYGIIDLYEMAYDNDATFHAEQNKHAAILLNPKIALGEMFPQLSFDVSHSRHVRHSIETPGSAQGLGGLDDEFSYDVGTWGLNLTQTLFDKEKLARFKQSKSETTQSQFELAAAHQDLILRLTTAYFDILTAKSHLAFVQAEKEAVAKQLQQAQKRFEVGLTPITDAKEAQAAYDLAVSDEIAARNSLENSYHRLEVITNQNIQQLMSLRDDIDVVVPQPDDPEIWISQALSDNFDVLAKKIATNIVRQEIDVQQAGHYPSLELFAQKNVSDVRGGISPRESDDTQLGVSMNVPLFSGGITYYRSKQAAQRHREALEILKETQREVRRSAREAYLNVGTSISQITALERAVESAQAAVDANQAGFNVGTRTSAEVLIALKDLFRTQRDYTEARHNYVLNTLRLKQAAGRLSKADLIQINGWLNNSPQ